MFYQGLPRIFIEVIIMKHLIYNVFNYLFRWNEFESAGIDFSEYNLKEIEKKLYPIFKLSYQSNDKEIIATFNSFKTTLIILYDSDENFVTILKETWN